MVLAGGLQVIYSRVFLDAVAWTGLTYVAWTPLTYFPNAAVLLSTVLLTLATCGLTSRWTVTFPMAPFVLLQLLRRSGENFSYFNLLFYGSIFLVVVSIFFSVLFPPLQIPKAQAGGPYGVGAVNFFVPCPDKEDSNSDAALNHTHVEARLLYPTSPDNKKFSLFSNNIPYMPPSIAVEFLRESMKVAGPPPLKSFDWLMHHWLLAELPIQAGVSLLESSEKPTLPVVVYSHGLMGSADLYSYQAMSLASQGMLVLMVNHLDGSAPIAGKHDGSRIFYDYDIIELWKQGKHEEYARERRSRTDWRVHEVTSAIDALLALNDNDNMPDYLKDAPYLSLKGRIQKNQIFFMGHSFGGATALAAAYRRPEMVENGGGVIAHEPMVDWIPDDARRSLFPKDRLAGLESSKDFIGGTGGLEYHTTTVTSSRKGPELHDLNLLLLYSDEWRQDKYGSSHIFEEMHQKGRMGNADAVAHFSVIKEAKHSEFSDMSMLTPLWLARGAGATGTRNPLETAREIEERTWKFVSAVLNQKKNK